MSLLPLYPANPLGSGIAGDVVPRWLLNEQVGG